MNQPSLPIELLFLHIATVPLFGRNFPANLPHFPTAISCRLRPSVHGKDLDRLCKTIIHPRG